MDNKTDIPFNRICKKCNNVTPGIIDANNHQICSICGEPYNEYRQYLSDAEIKISIQNRIDRIHTDLEIVRNEFIFSKTISKDYRFKKSIELNYFMQYLDELKSEISSKNIFEMFAKGAEY